MSAENWAAPRLWSGSNHRTKPKNLMNTTKYHAGTRLLCLLLLLLGAAQVKAQIPAVLTDRIYQGSGTINLLKDVSSSTLQSYLQNNGIARLGVDLNENLA